MPFMVLSRKIIDVVYCLELVPLRGKKIVQTSGTFYGFFYKIFDDHPVTFILIPAFFAEEVSLAKEHFIILMEMSHADASNNVMQNIPTGPNTINNPPLLN